MKKVIQIKVIEHHNFIREHDVQATFLFVLLEDKEGKRNELFMQINEPFGSHQLSEALTTLAAKLYIE